MKNFLLLATFITNMSAVYACPEFDTLNTYSCETTIVEGPRQGLTWTPVYQEVEMDQVDGGALVYRVTEMEELDAFGSDTTIYKYIAGDKDIVSEYQATVRNLEAVTCTENGFFTEDKVITEGVGYDYTKTEVKFAKDLGLYTTTYTSEYKYNRGGKIETGKSVELTTCEQI